MRYLLPTLLASLMVLSFLPGFVSGMEPHSNEKKEHAVEWAPKNHESVREQIPQVPQPNSPNTNGFVRAHSTPFINHSHSASLSPNELRMVLYTWIKWDSVTKKRTYKYWSPEQKEKIKQSWYQKRGENRSMPTQFDLVSSTKN